MTEECTLTVDELAERLDAQFGLTREAVERTLENEFLPSHRDGSELRVYVRDVEVYEASMREFRAKSAEVAARYHKPDDDIATTAEKIVESHAQRLIHTVHADPDGDTRELLEELLTNRQAVKSAEAVVSDLWGNLNTDAEDTP